MTDTQWTRRKALRAVVATVGSAAVLPSWAQSGGASAPAAASVAGAASESGSAAAATRSSREIRIGQSAHLSGPLAASFLPTVKGQQLAIEEANRKGGIGGRPVRLITLDDAYDPKRCVENTKTLVEREKVTALFGYASTGNILATLPLLSEYKLPLVCSYSGSPVLRAKHHPYFFTTMASYRDEVVQMVRNLITVQKSRFALCYSNSPFGQLMKPVVEEVAKELGATLVAQAPLETSGADAVACVQTIAAGSPDAIIFMAFGPSVISFVKAARAYIGVPIYCVSISNSSAALKALGDDARGLAFVQLVPFPFRQTTPITRDLAAVVTRANLEPSYDYMFGYLNMRIMLEGMRRAGKKVTSETIVKGMESLSNYDFGGYKVSYGPNKHHGSSFTEITIVGPGGRWLR